MNFILLAHSAMAHGKSKHGITLASFRSRSYDNLHGMILQIVRKLPWLHLQVSELIAIDWNRKRFGKGSLTPMIYRLRPHTTLDGRSYSHIGDENNLGTLSRDDA